MISGQQALRFIEQAAGTIRGQENELHIALQQVAAKAARLRTERAEAFKQLATVRLDALRAEKIAADLDAAERRALDLIAESESETARIATERARLEGERAKAETDRHARADDLAQVLQALENLQASVEPGVRTQADWRAQHEAVARAKAVADEAEKKAQTAEEDLAQKRKPYEADPLFMYLWRSGFGGPQYKSGFFVRFFDRMVANLVRYADARPNYAMLNEIPARLLEHARRCAQEIDAEKAKLAAIELAALRAAGSAELEARVASARKAAASADNALMSAEAAIAALDARHGEFNKTRAESAYESAVEALAKADGQETIAELYREARQTRTRADDDLIVRIERIDADIERSESEMADLRRQAQKAAHRRADVERERDGFRRRGWDNPYGQVRNESQLSDVLGQIVKGAIQGAVLGSVLKGGYEERRPRADTDFGGSGGFSFPFPSGDGGGDNSGGGWMGGGDDGFSTGGSI